MRSVCILLTLASLSLAVPAAAWKGELKAGVRPIAEVNARAESGDLVTVEGRIADVATGSGSRTVVTLEDASGSVLVRVPENLLRKLNGGHAPEVGTHVRVLGKWGHAALDDQMWGIHAQSAERVD